MMSTSGTGGSFGEAEAAALVASEDLLSRDNIPDENQQIECFSCGETMRGLFCHSCGQKNDDYRRSIWSLFFETFASIFSLENRMWRTWLMLLIKPGRVSREFSDGKRVTWTSPVRIYLALSIILFGYMSLTETRIFSVRTDIVPKAEFVGDVDTLEDASVTLKPDFGFFRRQAELDRLNAGTDFDRVARLITGIPRQVFQLNDDLSLLGELPSDELLKSSDSWPSASDPDEDEVEVEVDDQRTLALETYAEKVAELVDSYNNLLFMTSDPESIGTRIQEADKADEVLDVTEQIRFAATKEVRQLAQQTLLVLDEDLAELGLTRADIHKLPVETTNGYAFNLGAGSVNGVKFSETDIQELSVKVLKNPALLNEGISKYLPRIMFLMMPLAAIIGLVFIRGKNTALLYDHLVHAAYIHAVTFAFLLTLILLSQWTPLGGMVQVFFIGIAIYLPLSAKNMFKRGWFKTIFASYSIAIFYGFNMFVIVAILTGQSIVQAAALGG
ncbi:MAG: DUF3667 domain-containing protein [Litorimonas sp.]